MAPRKRTKGKKPTETMRQRQMRLRKMQRALKSAKKQLPPGKKGGAMVKAGSSKPMSPRLKAALDKQKRAAQVHEAHRQQRTQAHNQPKFKQKDI